MSDYRRNHYVPQWYQKRFIPKEGRDNKFFYLDLNPPILQRKGHSFRKKALNRWGPPRCFCETDLYTTEIWGIESTEIEKKFFGKVDRNAKGAVEAFANFYHPYYPHDDFENLLVHMSLQKLRTPKGLEYLKTIAPFQDKNIILTEMQRLKRLYCAIWSESIWQIADASNCSTKFIISDHPVSVYNKGFYPRSKKCLAAGDPEVWLNGTHTIYPLSLNKILIMTNLSWIRNPYQSPKVERPNPNPLRDAFFNFMQIQCERYLTETEVNEINYIIKSRAFQYIAAGKEEWLYPEDNIASRNWEKLGKGYLLMPDPRSVNFSKEVFMGYTSGATDSFDEYGNKPWDKGYADRQRSKSEWVTFNRFKGEFAFKFGPKRRGRSWGMGALEPEEDGCQFRFKIDPLWPV